MNMHLKYYYLIFIVCFDKIVAQNSNIDDAGTKSSTTAPRVLHHNEMKHRINAHLRTAEENEKNLFERMKLPYCNRPAHCYKIPGNTTCMGTKLPYQYSTFDLTDLNSLEIIQEKLQMYQSLRNIPKCWAVIQPFLCSLYMPKCDNNNNKVDLPSKEMCRIILGPCKILYNTTYFPEFMKCEDERLFPSKCRNEVQEMKFNISGQCLEPLVLTDSPAWYYKDVEGCGLKCKDPLYTDTEHKQIHKFVAWGAGICLLFNAFTVATFMVDWRSANKYPALVIFYINCCFLVSCIGWLAQFYGPDSRDDIVCRKDGTLRKSEPSAGENLSCVVIFVLVYYFLMAGMVWFVILTYAWHMSFQAMGKIQERIDKKRAYFHLFAWSFPLIMTITTMALGEIDGDSISGICFVGYQNPAARGGLLLGPLAAVLCIGGYFLLRGLLTLIHLKIGSREIISVRASSKIRSTIVRMGLFSLLIVIFGITTFVCHTYNFLNEPQWKESLRSFILCRLTNGSSDWIHCRQETRPSVAMLQLHLLILFATGIVMSSWVWTHSTVEAWTRFVRRKFNCEIEEPLKLQKHKVIAQAFAKRKMLYHAGRLSISFHNTHTDPVGLNFELNSVGSNDLSSTWAAALPKLVNRRGALTGAVTGSVSSQRRNSIDSEISFSVRRVSVESRRNSVDSQLSVQIAELKTTTRKSSSSRWRHRPRRRKRDRRARRESSTSLDSQLGTRLLNALAAGSGTRPNLGRRTASAGLHAHHVTELLAGGKLVVPFAVNGDSEDENVSLTISESRFNLVVSGAQKHVGDRRSPHIEEMSTDDRPAHVPSDDSSSLTSFCPELSRLAAVHSSLNSAGSANKCPSKQSKTSIDVGVQANAREIATQTRASYDHNEDPDNDANTRCISQGTQMSPRAARDRINKRNYRNSGSAHEMEPLHDKTDYDHHRLLKHKNNIKILTKKT